MVIMKCLIYDGLRFILLSNMYKSKIMRTDMVLVNMLGHIGHGSFVSAKFYACIRFRSL